MAKKKTNIKGKKVSQKDSKLIDALTRISEAIVSDLYLEDILKLIVAVTAQVMNSKICSLLLLDESGKELSVKATQSVSDRYNKKPNVKVGEGIAGIVAETGEPITVPDVKEDLRYKNSTIAKKEKLCSLLCVPLVYKGKVIGVLNSYTAQMHKFTHKEIDVLRSIANQAAVVIENFRLVVEARVIKEELESRKTIERAKGILMKQDKLSEKEAYERIRKYSMDNRRSMREVSEAIILTEDMSRNNS